MAAGPPTPPVPPPRHGSDGSPSVAVPSGPRRALPNREGDPPDLTPQGRESVQSRVSRSSAPSRHDIEDTRVSMGHHPPTRFFEINDGSGEGKYHDERGRGRPWDRDRERPFPTDLPTGPRAMDHGFVSPILPRRVRSPPRQQRSERSPPHFQTDDPRKSDQHEERPLAGPSRPYLPDRAFVEQERQRGGDSGVTNKMFEVDPLPQSHGYRSRPTGPDSLPSKPRFNQQIQSNRPAFNPTLSSANGVPVVTRNTQPSQETFVATHEATTRHRPDLLHAAGTSSLSEHQVNLNLFKFGDSQLTRVQTRGRFDEERNMHRAPGNFERRRSSFSGAPDTHSMVDASFCARDCSNQRFVTSRLPATRGEDALEINLIHHRQTVHLIGFLKKKTPQLFGIGPIILQLNLPQNRVKHSSRSPVIGPPVQRAPRPLCPHRHISAKGLRRGTDPTKAWTLLSPQLLCLKKLFLVGTTYRLVLTPETTLDPTGKPHPRATFCLERPRLHAAASASDVR
ncbi:hypothetical protein K439DRAFT_229614 [Ramaria rubella]|nr:hypothetical protein K439DRAFT_229614 [Ramaria rubella]